MKNAKKLAFIPRLLTANLRSLPSFIIIGAQKGGSSALYQFICAHPQVKRAFVKEPHYFSGQYMRKSLQWYKAQFPIKNTKLITGEASPSYCTHPLAPKRIKETLPNAKLLFIVRNPVERAASNYFHSLRYGVEKLPIEDAFKRPLNIFEKEYDAMEQDENYHSQLYHRLAYIHKGFYGFHYHKWLQYFSKNQIFIIENNELLTQPKQVYADVLAFLDVEPWQFNGFKKHNVGNSQNLPQALNDTLREIYKEPNQRFFELIGKTYNW